MRQRIFLRKCEIAYDVTHFRALVQALAYNLEVEQTAGRRGMRRNYIVSYPEILGRTIRSRREELGIDQDTLAERTGIPQSTISRIERGEALLNSEQVSYFADALMFSPSDFWIRADAVKNIVQARGATILRERVSREMVNSTPLLVTGAALTALIASVSGGDDPGGDGGDFF